MKWNERNTYYVLELKNLLVSKLNFRQQHFVISFQLFILSLQIFVFDYQLLISCSIPTYHINIKKIKKENRKKKKKKKKRTREVRLFGELVFHTYILV